MRARSLVDPLGTITPTTVTRPDVAGGLALDLAFDQAGSAKLGELTGKAIGRTSLLLIFAGNKQRQYDLVVHPSAALPATSAPASPEPHSVLVHRGDQVSQRFFLRDKSELWIELGTVKDTEAPKK